MISGHRFGTVALAAVLAMPAVAVAGDGSAAVTASRDGSPALVRAVLPATVTVDAATVLRRLPADLLGSNIQYPDDGDGVLDPATGQPYPAAVAAIRGLGPATIRFPGGSHSDVYHWRDGVGPPGDRPEGTGYFDGRPIANDYGTDEHMALCAAVEAEPTITANFGTGTPQEAANWVEYCNGEAPTAGTESWTTTSWGGGDAAPPGYFAWLRAELGHPEPYGVHRWEVGNEVYNDWSELYSAAEYADRFVDYCEAMKAVDPSIRVAAVGYDQADAAWHAGDTPWNRTVATVAGSCLDALHIHTYAPAVDGDSVVMVSNGEAGDDVDLPVSADYQVAVAAQGLNLLGDYPPADGQYALLEVRVDGVRVHTFILSAWLPAVWRATLHLAAGHHHVAFAFTNDLYDPAARNGRDVVLGREATLSGAGGTWTLELGPEPLDAMAAMAGPSAQGADAGRIAEILRVETGRSGLEVWVTEVNLFYGIAGLRIDRVQEFRAAPTLARYAIDHVRGGVSLIQQWSLLADWQFGMLHDSQALGRRATGEVFPLLRRGLTGDLLASTVTAPGFAMPRKVGNAPAGLRTSWLDAAATREGDEVRVLLVNGHPDAAMRTRLAVGNLALASEGQLTTVSSAGCDTVDGNPDESAYAFGPGVVGQALHLDRTLPLTEPSTGRVSAGAGTLELWLRPDWTPGDGIVHALLSLGLTFQLGVNEDGLLLAFAASELGDTADWAVADARGWHAGEWHHVAVTWDAAALRLFVDGAEQYETPRAAQWTWVDPNYGVVLGTAALTPEGSLDGWLDEVRIERRALSAAEVAADWQRGASGQELARDTDTGLLLHLDGSLADAVRDERTHVVAAGLAVAGGVATFTMPPCSVALAAFTAAGTE